MVPSVVICTFYFCINYKNELLSKTPIFILHGQATNTNKQIPQLENEVKKDMTKVRIHLLVHGRVQGVFFRANMKRVAEENNVTGWVRNLPDGRTVEAVLEGEREAVERVVCWALHGPPAARVEALEVKFEEYRGEFSEMSIRY